MKEYKISIVTPFHNVDMSMFRKAFRSMTSQTYGINNIQWIIVVHNSGDEYLNAVKELVKGYDSIEIYELKNDVHSPSSPRNYGMEHATGKYLGFLDGDDSFTPACIETALKHIEATCSQMVVFRREYELEDPNCIPITELTLWNQTQDEVVMERGSWDKEKMFSVAWGFVTSRIFEREFLVREGIKFDDEIPFGEDQYFCAMAYGKVDRVCYLPNFIGYHYFINDASIVQSKDAKSGQTCINYARGFNRVFSLGMHYEIPMDTVIMIWSHYIVMCMMGSPDITPEQIRQVCAIMRPYVRMLEPPKPSKIFSQAEIDRMTAQGQKLLRPDEIIAEKYAREEDGIDGVEARYKLLAKLVRDNVKCDIVDKYGVKDYAEFLSKFPCTTYDEYAPLIELAMRIGEKDLFTSSPVECYALSSGTMGQTRYIPCTREHIDDFTAEFVRILDNKRSLVLFEAMPVARTNDGGYIDTISGITLRNFVEANPKRAEYLLSSPQELLFPEEVADMLYARLLFALKDKEIRQIIAPFTWGIQEIFASLEKNCFELCNDIEKGKISPLPALPENIREALNAKLTPDKARAFELRSIFLHGFEEPVVPKIWPKLERIIAAGTGAFEIYTDNMRRYTGNIPHSNGIYATSEALIARAEGDESDKYIMCPECGYYEFVPLGAEKPLSYDELETGKAYELIATNKSGFYRYRLGDVVTIVNADNIAPVIRFNHRSGQHYELNGVPMTERDIYHALRDTVRLYGIEMSDYAYWPDDDARTWEVFIEPFSRSLETVSKADVKRMSEMFNLRLEQINRRYSRALADGVIVPCELKFSQPETHMLYRDVERYRRNTTRWQIKPVHFVDGTNEVIKRFFMKNILDTK